MNRLLTLTGAGLCLASALGCSSSSKPSGNTGGSGGAAGTSSAVGGGSSAGSGGKSSVNGPAITSAPPAWVRPADCGGVGNLCPNLSGCAAKSACQLFGNVCIPAFDATKPLPGRSAETPYCAAYSCMTFDQASCFCTGEAGKTEPACESPSALALLCVSKGSSCATDPCCDGYSCVDVGHGQKQCQVACKTNTDCADTGCCTDPHETGVNICSPKAACDTPCKKTADTTCTPGTTTTASDCCDGNCFPNDVPAFAGCRASCATSADCKSGCCQPYSDGTYGFCTDAVYCTCAAVGTACGSAPPYCCAGNTCGGNDTDGYKCAPSCKVNADCATKCCSLFTGEDNGICADASRCSP